MSVQLLLNKLRHVENNFIVGFYANTLLATNHEGLFAMPVHIGSMTLDASHIVSYLSTKEGKELLIGEYSNALLRTLIRESTESIANYANESNQYSNIEYEDTFNFARIIRNSFAHDYVISLSGFYKKILASHDITWGGKVITLGMEGDKMEKTFFGYIDALNLFHDLEKICKAKLT